MPPLCWQKDKPVVGFTPAVLMEGRCYRTPEKAAEAWIERRLTWRSGGRWNPKYHAPSYLIRNSREYKRFKRRAAAHFLQELNKLQAMMPAEDC